MNSLAKIELRGVRIEYVDEERGIRHLAVSGLNLDIFENEFLCVVGPSGCGKSTIVSAIAGFLPPTDGSIVMDGKPIVRPGADRGVVFQEYALLPWKTVIQNVALGLEIRGIARKEREEEARRFLAMVNLGDAADKYPHELSGGMKQRAAVARTLVNSPQVILMDEPFAAVDAQTRLTLQEELLRIWSDAKVTVLFVTHQVEEAIFLGDRVVVMSGSPGTVKAEMKVRIPRSDRRWDTINDNPTFQSMRDEILAQVRH